MMTICPELISLSSQLISMKDKVFSELHDQPTSLLLGFDVHV